MVEVGVLIIGNDEYLMVDEEQRQMVVVVCVCVGGGGCLRLLHASKIRRISSNISVVFVD